MDRRWLRVGGWALIWAVGFALWWWSGEPTATASSNNWTIPPVRPQLTNPRFECADGYTAGVNPNGEETLIPNGWTAFYALGSPRLLSVRLSILHTCGTSDEGRWIERAFGGGYDSLTVRSEDLERLPEPGKPFDVLLYHQVPATTGGAYSLSAWMASKCGNDNPVDCPDGNYIAKAIGIDPYGGTEHNSPAIVWVENRENLGWKNLYTSVTALADTITVFARMTSPFQFHGNLGFMDEFSLVRAPLSAMKEFSGPVKGGGEIVLNWEGQQSADVLEIGGTYELLFDLQARPLPGGEWRDLVIGATEQMSTTFQAPCMDIRYEFRVRARAEQPPAPPEGVAPNHRYPGVWSKPQVVTFTAPVVEPITPTVPITVTAAMTPSLYLPMAGSNKRC
jgi:hypothetical protein